MSTNVVAGNEVGAQRSAVKRTPLLDPIDIGDAVCGRKRAATAILAAPISQLAVQAVKRIDAVVGIERKISGLPAARRRERSAVLVAALETGCALNVRTCCKLRIRSHRIPNENPKYER